MVNQLVMRASPRINNKLSADQGPHRTNNKGPAGHKDHLGPVSCTECIQCGPVMCTEATLWSVSHHVASHIMTSHHDVGIKLNRRNFTPSSSIPASSICLFIELWDPNLVLGSNDPLDEVQLYASELGRECVGCRVCVVVKG